MRNSRPIEQEPVSVKTPGERRIALEPDRVCDLFKREPEFRQRLVGAPKAFATAKIRQPRIHSHAGTRRNHECICAGNGCCG
jgi:hypothetical protein